MGDVVEFNPKNQITDEQVDQIAEAMQENVEESESLKKVADLPSNNGVEEADGIEEGREVKAKVVINANGAAVPTMEEDDDDEELGMDFDELVDKATKELNESDLKVDITPEDIQKQLEQEQIYFKNMEFTNDEVLQILHVVKKYQNKEKFNVFKALPIKIQNELNKYLGQGGYTGYSLEANTMRNDLAEIIMDEFIHNISLDKYTMDFQKEMDALEEKINKEFSKMYMDYAKERDTYIKSIMEGEEDETKKEVIGNILDAINDGYALERIKQAAPKIRIKHIEVEKPKKAFDNIINQYSTSTFNIYSPYTACSVLTQHLKDQATEEEVIKFFIVICKFCMNYHAENPVHHAFMYYAMYNPILLDVYKGEEYDEFSKGYLANVMDVINIIRK
jgi:hypothetical protein